MNRETLLGIAWKTMIEQVAYYHDQAALAPAVNVAQFVWMGYGVMQGYIEFVGACEGRLTAEQLAQFDAKRNELFVLLARAEKEG